MPYDSLMSSISAMGIYFRVRCIPVSFNLRCEGDVRFRNRKCAAEDRYTIGVGPEYPDRNNGVGPENSDRKNGVGPEKKRR